MFLLIPSPNENVASPPRIFTFHNVSINTSTKRFNRATKIFFTFHNVSINTYDSVSYIRYFSPLHSTMFLLIHGSGVTSVSEIQFFTFHNVSINTSTYFFCQIPLANFTFHNVSINTAWRHVNCHVTYLFTFHNVSINTRAPHPHIIQDLFYHFLSTLSFTIFLKQNLHSQ